MVVITDLHLTVDKEKRTLNRINSGRNSRSSSNCVQKNKEY